MTDEGGGELLVDDLGAVRVWRLNRPARRNALSGAQLARLDAARAGAEARGCAVVVITGEPADGAFCAGFDLDDLARARGGLAPGREPQTPVHATFAGLEAASFSVVTAVNGAAIGAGCELALLGDVRVARPGVSFLLPPAKLGLGYPAEGLRRLRDALGASLLRAMLETALPVSSDRLMAAGVLWSLADDPLAEATALATRLAALSPEARSRHRAALRALR